MKWDSYLTQKQIFSQDPTLFDKFFSSLDDFCKKKKMYQSIIYLEIFVVCPRSKLFYYQTDTDDDDDLWIYTCTLESVIKVYRIYSLMILLQKKSTYTNILYNFISLHYYIFVFIIWCHKAYFHWQKIKINKVKWKIKKLCTSMLFHLFMNWVNLLLLSTQFSKPLRLPPDPRCPTSVNITSSWREWQKGEIYESEHSLYQ